MSVFFTTKEANEALPEVIEEFENILSIKSEIEELEEAMEKNAASNGSLEERITIKQRLNSKISEFYKCVEFLELAGIILKSIDERLLDFPSKRFDEEIWLCWKYGETEIKFWHEKDSGFSNRKPIEVSNESLV